MMNYVYVLVNARTTRLYIGFSTNLRQRVASHQTKDADWQLAYYEAYTSEAEARKRERDLKQYGSAWGHLKRRIQSSLNLRKGGRSFELKPR
jgi:predicted GIY-YIG superfamily endonuclease